MAIEMIRLNLIPEGKMPVVHCKQYDVDRSFKVCVYEGDKPYIFTDETVELNVRKSDTTLVTTDLDVISGEHCLVVSTTQQMCAVVGKNECEIRVIKDGANIGSLNFIMEIKRSPTEGGLRSDSEINNLQRQMEDIIDPMLDEKVPPKVEELVPQIIGDDYYTAEETDEAIENATEGKADATYVDTELAKKADKDTTYTKQQTDEKFATNRDLGEFRTLVDGELDRKMDKANPTGTGSFSLNRKADTTIGSNSVAVGLRTTASASSSLAEGSNTTASGTASHAEGNRTVASGNGSHAEGGYTVANHKSQHVFGECNIPDDSTAQPTAKGNYIEIVGNGTVDHPANARTLDWSGNETLAGDLKINGNQSLTGEISRLDNRITELPEAMVFKGTLGVNGDIQTLPMASAENEGWTFKCITAGTYSGLTLKVGDTVTCFNPPNTSVYEWDISGYGDTDTDTWRSIKVNGTEALGSGISSGSVDFVDTDTVETEFDSDGNKIGFKTKNIYTESEVDALLDDKTDKEDTYTKEQVDDIVYNIMPDDTASGSVANFQTPLAMPLKSLKIDVNATQDLHGQSGAYPAGGSAQKWDEETEFGSFDTETGEKTPNNNLLRSVTPIPVSPNTTYLRRMNESLGCRIFQYDSNMDFISQDVSSERLLTFATANNCAFINIAFQKAATGVGINYPSTDTDYHPYSNICPIEGWSETKIAKRRKNLFNVNELALVDVGTTTGDRYGVYLHKSGTFTVSGVYNGSVEAYIYARKKLVDGSFSPTYTVQTGAASTSSPKTVTVNEGETLILYNASANQTEALSKEKMSSFQIEVGSSASTYEPYNGNTEVINLGGTYYGGHLTQDKAGHRQFEVDRKLKTVDGSTGVTVASSSYIKSDACDGYINDDEIQPRVSAEYQPDLLCNRLTQAKGNIWSNVGHADEFCINNRSIHFNISNASLGIVDYTQETMETVKTKIDAFLQNNPVVVVIPITPIVIDLPDGEPISTLIGTNNIFADTGDTSVVFKDSVNGYVEKKIASVQALALNT